MYADAAMSEFDRFECGKAAAVLFGQALVVLTQQLFDCLDGRSSESKTP